MDLGRVVNLKLGLFFKKKKKRKENLPCLIVDTEKVLVAWTEDQTSYTIPLTQSLTGAELNLPSTLES